MYCIVFYVIRIWAVDREILVVRNSDGDRFLTRSNTDIFRVRYACVTTTNAYFWLSFKRVNERAAVSHWRPVADSYSRITHADYLIYYIYTSDFLDSWTLKTSVEITRDGWSVVERNSESSRTVWAFQKLRHYALSTVSGLRLRVYYRTGSLTINRTSH